VKPTQKLSSNLDRYQFWVAAGILDGPDSIFGRESSHYQCQLAVGCRLNWSFIDAQYVFRSTRATPVHFHKELGVCHGFLPARAQNNEAASFGITLRETLRI
jgi:hypothetical protein